MKYVILLFLLAISIGISAQNLSRTVIGSSGNTSNQSPQLEWTLGETIVNLYSTNQNVLSQGFQQGSLVITAIEDVAPNIEINVYPNPAVSSIFVEYDNAIKLKGRLYSMTGSHILNKEFNGGKETIDLSKLQSGMYLLQIFDETHIVKTFKIQKTN